MARPRRLEGSGHWEPLEAPETSVALPQATVAARDTTSIYLLIFFTFLSQIPNATFSTKASYNLSPSIPGEN